MFYFNKLRGKPLLVTHTFPTFDFIALYNRTAPPKRSLMCCKWNWSWATDKPCIQFSKPLHYLYPERQLLLLCFRIWGERNAKAAKRSRYASDMETFVRPSEDAGPTLHLVCLRGAHRRMQTGPRSFLAQSQFIFLSNSMLYTEIALSKCIFSLSFTSTCCSNSNISTQSLTVNSLVPSSIMGLS